MKYPDFYQSWLVREVHNSYKCHDNNALYEQILSKDEERAWLFIEEKYLDHYRELIKVNPDTAETGLYAIEYPGHLGGWVIDYDYLPLPEAVIKKIQEWMAYFDDCALGESEKPFEKRFDWDFIDSWGLSVAKEVKRNLPPNIYVEYNYFKELVVRDNEVIELDVPEFIRQLTMQKSI